MTDSTYVLDNAAPEAGQRFTSLEALYDPTTFRNLEATGVAAGWRCLEVGAGGGSVARWLAERAGPSGHVLATDVNPRWLAHQTMPGVEVRDHDIAHDPLPEGAFDLIHARLVLVHIPARAAVLRRLVAALRPGGWLAIDDFDLELIPRRVDVVTAADDLVDKVTAAFHTLLATRGVEVAYGRTLPGAFEDAGLVDVHADGYVAIAPGGTPGAQLYQANIEQTRDQLIHAGLATKDETERYCELLADPRRRLTMPVLISARARRP
jgi:SAM-dependent methyltransferase